MNNFKTNITLIIYIILGLYIIFGLGNKPMEIRNYILLTDHKTIKLKLEIAENIRDLEKGLSNRSNLAEDEGMLFVFTKKPRILTFWMKDTLIPLDLMFLDEDMVIQEIHEGLKPMDETKISSLKPYNYGLELREGFVKENNIKIGDKILPYNYNINQ